jgi:hypothetical protein
MSQLTIKLSDKADALIAQLQKEIFNRRRKKVSPAGVVETLVESGAKSQSDKRFATSWKNLIADIEKAAKVANAHGSKPANLSDAEWALILSHRSRAATKGAAAKTTTRKASTAKPAVKGVRKAAATAKPAAKSASKPAVKSAAKAAPKAAKPAAKTTAKAAPKAGAKTTAAKAKPLKAARNPIRKSAVKGTAVKPAAASQPAAKPVAKPAARRKAKPAAAKAGGSSVARRMAKAVSRLSSSGAVAPAAPSSNGVAPLAEVR